MTDLRKAAEELMPILDRWKMTYPPCTGADWDKIEALRKALKQTNQTCPPCNQNCNQGRTCQSRQEIT